MDKPFRCCIADIFKGKSIWYWGLYWEFAKEKTKFVYIGFGTGTCVSGRLESGHVQVGEAVLLLPANELATIKCMCVVHVNVSSSILLMLFLLHRTPAMTVSEEMKSWAVAGDQVLLSLANVDVGKIK